MLSEKNRILHNGLREYIRLIREQDIYNDLYFPDRINRAALSIANTPTKYWHGGRLMIDSKRDEPITRSFWHRKFQGDVVPGFECAGLIEALLYALGVLDKPIFTYQLADLRKVPKDTKFYKEAADKKQGYKVNWNPQAGPTIYKDSGISDNPWAQTVHLLFFRKEFEPVYSGMWPELGDLVFFAYHGTDRQWHFHVGLWGYNSYLGREGLIHSSPGYGKNKRSGVQFTPHDSDFYGWLEPQRGMWAEWFGTSLVRWRDKK